MTTIHSQETASTVELIRTALDEARELVKVEVALARNDLDAQWRRARTAAIAFAVAACACNAALTVVICAVALATQMPAAVSVLVALALFASSGAAAWIGFRAIPERLLGRTRARLETDVRELRQIGEHADGS